MDAWFTTFDLEFVNSSIDLIQTCFTIEFSFILTILGIQVSS